MAQIYLSCSKLFSSTINYTKLAEYITSMMQQYVYRYGFRWVALSNLWRRTRQGPYLALMIKNGHEISNIKKQIQQKLAWKLADIARKQKLTSSVSKIKREWNATKNMNWEGYITNKGEHFRPEILLFYSPWASTTILSIPLGPRVVRIASPTTSHAFMLLTSCGMPCDVSVPSFNRIIWGRYEREISCYGLA